MIYIVNKNLQLFKPWPVLTYEIPGHSLSYCVGGDSGDYGGDVLGADLRLIQRS